MEWRVILLQSPVLPFWGVALKCRMQKVKCGMDRAENCCGMVWKLWNAESLQIYSVTAERSLFAPQGSYGTRVPLSLFLNSDIYDDYFFYATTIPLHFGFRSVNICLIIIDNILVTPKLVKSIFETIYRICRDNKTFTRLHYFLHYTLDV